MVGHARSAAAAHPLHRSDPAIPNRPPDLSSTVDREAAIATARSVLFERNARGTAVTAPDGTVLDVNPEFERIMGRDRGEMIGRSLVDLAQADHRPLTLAWMDRAARGDDTPLHSETKVGDEPGRARWFVTDGVAARDDDGRLVALVLSVEEATAARRLHGQLASAHNDFAALVELLPVAVCRSRAGTVLVWNPAAEQLFGWAAADVVGRSADSRDDADDDLSALLAGIAASDRMDGDDVTVRTKAGETLQVRAWTAPVLGPKGQPETLSLVVDLTEDVRIQRAVELQEHRWRSLVKNVADVITVVDADGYVQASAGEVRTILGYPQGTWTSARIHDLVHPDDLSHVEGVMDEVLARPGVTITTETRLRHQDGTWIDVGVSAINQLDDPAVAGLVVTTHNITERKRAQALVASQSHILELIGRGEAFDDVMESVAAMVEDHDDGTRVAVLLIDGDRFRPRYARMSGPPGRVRARLVEIEVGSLVGLLDPEGGDGPVVMEASDPDSPLDRALRATMTREEVGTMWLSPVVDRADRNAGAVIVGFNRHGHRPSDHARRAIDTAASLVSIALERRATVNELAHRSLHDDLTGLPNRTLLLDRLQTSLDRVQRLGRDLGVLYVDLDRFKLVNDSLGLAGGDDVLTQVAARLNAVTRPDDTIARVAADEFVIVCDRRDGGLAAVLSVADRLTEAMKEPFTSGQGELFLTASLGLALSTPGVDAASLLRHADAAMYRAKQRGRDRLEMYDAAMQASAHDRLALSSDLRRALEKDELYLVYQPIIQLGTGAVVGAEALCRWHHPRRGEIPPGAFIPVAEESGTIAEIGSWVLDTALAELAAVPALTDRPFTLSVNLSPRQLDDQKLVARVSDALDAHGWSPDRLCLELTETAITQDLDAALRTLVRLRQGGVRVAVDDFGTGYSSLTHLHRLPIDIIKIDRSFITPLGETAPTDRSTVASVVLGIAQAMDLMAVAEGVETSAQLNALRDLGCELGQGYLFSVPVPAAALVNLLDEVD